MTAYEIFLGRRYLSAGRGNRFLSFISLISMAGVAIGVAVLIVVLSVMNGFETELRSRILGMTSHATIMGFGGSLADWRDVQQRALVGGDIRAAAPFIEEQGMLVADSQTSGALVRGVLPDEESAVSAIASRVTAGSFDRLEAGRYGIVLGVELATALGVGLGDRVVLVIPQGAVTPAGIVPRLRRFEVVGVFSAGMYEYDRNLAYLHMADAARLYRLGDGVTGLRLRLDDLFAAPQVVRSLAEQMGGGYYISDWTREHANFFRSIRITKSVMFVILLLVVAVAAFNIVSTLVMVVKDKRPDIAILRTMGSAPRSILAVFVTQGTVIGLIGTMAGVALGTLIATHLESLVHGLERLLGTQFLDAQLYFMSDLPARVELPDVVRISLTAFGLCCLSTLYPAWRAARIQPAEALRRE